MKFLNILLVFGILNLTNQAFAGAQFIRCTNPDTEVKACWQTFGGVVVISATNDSYALEELPFELQDKQGVHTNFERSLFIQTRKGVPQILIDDTGKKFMLKCEPAANGLCH